MELASAPFFPSSFEFLASLTLLSAHFCFFLFLYKYNYYSFFSMELFFQLMFLLINPSVVTIILSFFHSLLLLQQSKKARRKREVRKEKTGV